MDQVPYRGYSLRSQSVRLNTSPSASIVPPGRPVAGSGPSSQTISQCSVLSLLLPASG